MLAHADELCVLVGNAAIAGMTDDLGLVGSQYVSASLREVEAGMRCMLT